MSSARIDVVMMATVEIEHYAGATKRMWRSYADRHGYAFAVYDTVARPDLHINWSKIEHGRRHLRGTACDWMIVTDADSAVHDREKRLEELVCLPGNPSLVFSADVARRWGMSFPLNPRSVMETRQWVLPNAGFFAVRNDAVGQAFMEEWMELATGAMAHLADRVPRDQLVLWLGLLPKWRQQLGILGPEVVRVLNDRHWRHLLKYESNIFVRHDKRFK